MNAKNNDGYTLFIMACKEGDFDVVKLLLDNADRVFIDINARTNNGETGLNWAFRCGQKDVVKLLLGHPNCNDIDMDATDIDAKNTLFVEACQEGHQEIVQLMLDNADRLQIDINGRYPKYRPHRHRHRSLINARDNNGRTGLLLACRYGQKKIVELLLGHPNSQNVIDAHTIWTAYQVARFRGDVDMIQLFLDHPKIREGLTAANEVEETIDDMAHFSI